MTRPVGRPPIGRPGEGQDGLPGLADLLPGPTPPPGYGATARAVHVAVAAALAPGGPLESSDLGMAQLAVELGRAVDLAAANGNAREIAAAGRELRETLSRLRLDPSARGGGGESADDALARFLDSLSTPQVGDPA